MKILVEKFNIEVDTEEADLTKTVNRSTIYYFYYSNISLGINSSGQLICIKFNEERLVQQKEGTGTRSPRCRNCGAWINHWQNFVGIVPDKCCIIPCAKEKNRKTLNRILEYCDIEIKKIGAHVIHVLGREDEMEFIIPVCESDNPPTAREITVAEGTWFVRADQDICG